jgi:hypothetical protein
METITVGGRRYTDPDIISLIRATGQLVDPRSAVIHQARQLNTEYGSFGNEAGPFERLKILASLRGLEIDRMNRHLASREVRDAVLIPTSDGKRVRGQILYNPTRPPGRVAFSIAHEIAHTFFPNSVSGARFRTMCTPDSREANELERLCDFAASELLMPLEEFLKVTNKSMGLNRSSERDFWKFIRGDCVQNGDGVSRPRGGGPAPVSFEKEGTNSSPNLKQATPPLSRVSTKAI